jgi:hypothetical protein
MKEGRRLTEVRMTPVPKPDSTRKNSQTEPSGLSLSEVRYEQTHHYHPFARETGDGEWVVEVPGMDAPVGYVRLKKTKNGALTFRAYPCQGITENIKPFPGAHPTLFHAVAWLRWQTDSY